MDFERRNANEWNHIPHSVSAPQEANEIPEQKRPRERSHAEFKHERPLTTVDRHDLTVSSSTLAKTYANAAKAAVPGQAVRVLVNPHHNVGNGGKAILLEPLRFAQGKPQTSDGSQNTQRRVKFESGASAAVELDESRESDTNIVILRQVPNPLSYEALVTGFFPWPSGEIAPTSLGQDYHRLDRIRLNFGCYIVFDEETTAFKVFGKNFRNVSHTIEAIGQVLREALAMQMGPTTVIVIDPPTDRSFSRVVVFPADDKRSPSPAAGLTHGRAGEIACAVQSPKIMDSRQLNRLSKLETMTLQAFELAFADRLGTLRYHKKPVHLNCVLGIFLWKVYKWQPAQSPDQPLLEFMSNLQDKRTQGSLHALTSQAQILKRVFNLRTRWRPEYGDVQSLSDFKPVYEGLFTLQPDKPGQDNYQLVVIGHERMGQIASLLQRSWKLSESEEERSVHFQASFTRLHRGLSWGLELATGPTSTAVPEAYREFAQKVIPRKNFQPWNGEHDISLAFEFPTVPKLKTFRQRAVWRFSSQEDRDLSLEVVKIDEYEVVRTKDAAGRRLNSKWEARINHRRFGAQLAEFSRLGPSDAQFLRAKTADFFPDYRGDTETDSILQNFVRKMRSIVDELSQVRLK